MKITVKKTVAISFSFVIAAGVMFSAISFFKVQQVQAPEGEVRAPGRELPVGKETPVQGTQQDAAMPNKEKGEKESGGEPVSPTSDPMDEKEVQQKEKKDERNASKEQEAKGCIVTGCSSEICAEEPVITSCAWKESFTCYQNAVCERQPSGECGWTPTLDLIACLTEKGE